MLNKDQLESNKNQKNQCLYENNYIKMRKKVKNLYTISTIVFYMQERTERKIYECKYPFKNNNKK